jgi:putative transcriptional regulator
MPSRRHVAFIRSVALAVVGAVVVWFGASAIPLAILGPDVQAAAPWLALAKFASLAWVIAVGWLVSWRRLDEREQETR